MWTEVEAGVVEGDRLKSRDVPNGKEWKTRAHFLKEIKASRWKTFSPTVVKVWRMEGAPFQHHFFPATWIIICTRFLFQGVSFFIEDKSGVLFLQRGINRYLLRLAERKVMMVLLSRKGQGTDRVQWRGQWHMPAAWFHCRAEVQSSHRERGCPIWWPLAGLQHGRYRTTVSENRRPTRGLGIFALL